MTVRECYESVGSDFDGVLSRLGSEAIIKKFAVKFLKDTNFYDLGEAIQEQDGERAFRAAHTIKGVCLNLGFDRLYEVTADLTERLRGRDVSGCGPYYEKVKERYEELRAALEKLAMEE